MTIGILLLAILAIAVTLSAIMAGAWIVQQRTGNSGWVDTTWTFGLGVVGIAAALLLPPHDFPPREMTVAVLIALWAARLGIHIAARTAKIKDDPRYAKLAQDWGRDAPRRMFVFLQQQAFGSVPLALAVYLAAKNPTQAMRAQDYVGFAIVIVAILGEAIADWQLRQFQNDPANRGQILDSGLWAWSRHPNYFFQWFGWLAWPVIAIELAGGYPFGWLALVGPAVMYWVLRYATGVPHLEMHMERTRGAAFDDYKRRTSLFFPKSAEALKETGMKLISAASKIVERAPVPDVLTRAGIGILCGRTARSLANSDPSVEAAFARAMAVRPIAIHTQNANEQHYEVPQEFFGLVLGPHRKYSCCFYGGPSVSLGEAEERALRLSAEHAQLQDGQDILELGCGWGSLSLFMAQNYPKSRITAVSNSHSQREFIENEARLRQIRNLNVVTSDMNDFAPNGKFDRVVSVEMFEHMSNWRALFKRVRCWMKPDGRFFMHVFTHRRVPYRYETADKADWIAQYFFTGGIMPSHNLPRQFADLFAVEEDWLWDGTHYERTALDWLANFDARRDEIMPVLRSVYGNDAALWVKRWRIFFLATAGMFGHANGKEWGVSHYRMKAAG